MNAPLYTTEILRLAASLEEPHPLEREDGRAELRSPTCGSTISTAVQLDHDGRVAALSQVVQACAFGQAAATLVQRHALGLSRGDTAAVVSGAEAWLGGDDARSAEWLAPLAPARSKTGRHGAILLPLRALLAAMDSAL